MDSDWWYNKRTCLPAGRLRFTRLKMDYRETIVLFLSITINDDANPAGPDEYQRSLPKEGFWNLELVIGNWGLK
jgi:hypothetical protein